MLNFGASKPRVGEGPGPRAPPGSAPDISYNIVVPRYSAVPILCKFCTRRGSGPQEPSLFVSCYYRPQRSWGKVMFLRMSVIL